MLKSPPSEYPLPLKRAMSPVGWASRIHAEPGSFLEIVLDCISGVIGGQLRLINIAFTSWFSHVIRPFADSLLGRADQHNNVTLPKVQNGTIKVALVGYGRTGTYSLMMAMQELGYPTVHAMHWYEQLDFLDLWHKEIIMPSIKSGKVELGEPDFQKIADFGYTALGDLPMCLYFEQVMEQFPNSKFILTERSSSEVWFASWVVMTQSITNMVHLGRFFIPTLSKYSDYLRWLYAYLNMDDSILNMPWPVTDVTNKTTAIARYEEHNRRVKEIVPADRLLQYHLKDGWAPLCDFLEIENCPTTPFPKSNSRRSMKIQAVSAFVLGFFELYLIIKFVSRVFRPSRRSVIKKQKLA